MAEFLKALRNFFARILQQFLSAFKTPEIFVLNVYGATYCDSLLNGAYG